MKSKMTFTILILSLLSLKAPSVFALDNSGKSPAPTPAHPADAIVVDMKNGAGNSVGTAWITQKDQKGVSIQLDLHGLPAGTHGIHIHNKASCVGPDFKSAGDHFSPAHHKHGNVDGGQHEGDLPNIEVAADGTVKTTIVDDHANLGASLKSLQKGAGTSIVIHEKADDYKTQPSGNSGSRIACGEIAATAK